MNKYLITIAKYGISFLILAWLYNQTKQADQFDVPIINEFRGRRNVELQIIDWRKSEVASELVKN